MNNVILKTRRVDNSHSQAARKTWTEVSDIESSIILFEIATTKHRYDKKYGEVIVWSWNRFEIAE